MTRKVCDIIEHDNVVPRLGTPAKYKEKKFTYSIVHSSCNNDSEKVFQEVEPD